MAEVKWQARRVSDGVLVDVTGDTSGTPAGAPTANALEAGGTALFYAQATDPGAVGEGAIWKDTSLGVSSSTIWRERNIGNTAWEARAATRAISTGSSNSVAGSSAAATGTGNADVRLTAESNSGNANASVNASSTGGGEADASSAATASLVGSGDAYAQNYASTLNGTADATLTATSTGSGAATVKASATATTGTATAGTIAIRGAARAGIEAVVDGTSARIGFFGATPVAKAAANADTSGATLAALETEVNELKALLRAYGLLAT